MRKNNRNYRKFLEQFCREMEELNKNHPVKYLTVMALSSVDSEREPQTITGEIKESHVKIIREFYFRSHRN